MEMLGQISARDSRTEAKPRVGARLHRKLEEEEEKIHSQERKTFARRGGEKELKEEEEEEEEEESFFLAPMKPSLLHVWGQVLSEC